jgi:hypothetical protein
MTTTSDRHVAGGYWLFSAAIFSSAFLIFQVQPLLGKYILPWFGGTPAVWSTCLLFFQVLLFAGYLYAHLLARSAGIRVQCVIHLAALALALFLLPITPSSAWKPTGTEEPTLRILGLLAVSVGVPYFLLSANGPLLQAWFSRVFRGRSPYGLYSLSNVGSLLGLVSYPFLVEPNWSVDRQSWIWSWGFALFALSCAGCGWMVYRQGAAEPEDLGNASDVELGGRSGPRVLWFALPAAASVMLLAATNQVCIDVAAIPFLWVLPLTLYLLTFIISFAGPQFYPRLPLGILLAVFVLMLFMVLAMASGARFFMQLFVYFGTMFVCCLVCHGELVRIKPPPSQLTAFYLYIAAGGACGGLFVALLAPLLFSAYIEFHIGVWTCLFLAVVSYYRDGWRQSSFARLKLATSVVVLVLVGIGLSVLASQAAKNQIAAERNFFGVLRVKEKPLLGRTVRDLIHGQIRHGRQVFDPEFRRRPTTYYSDSSGAGMVLSQSESTRNIGIVGLGAGSLAAYGRTGDRIEFYEINPAVVQFANSYFTFLSDSDAQPGIVITLGDARLSMERQPPREFDRLFVDAFSSDAIPTHLLTDQAFEVYLKHLAGDGILAVHISNRHFDLTPVIRGAARRWNLWHSIVVSAQVPEQFEDPAIWCLLSRTPETLASLGLTDLEDPRSELGDLPAILWSDNYTNLLGVLKQWTKQDNQ